MADGHRERLRKRFKEESIETIPDYIVLEYMLHGIITRRDTCELARTLIKEFGSIPGVLDAPVSELCKVPGMGETAAEYIKLIPKFYRRYCLDQWNKPCIFNNVNDATKYLSEHFIGYDTEVLIVMCLDGNNKLLSCRPVFEGSINAIDISVRKILQFALAFDSARVIIGHNHLHGDALPSLEDLDSTQQIFNALLYAGIRLDDHIIFSNGDHISLAQSNIIPTVEDPSRITRFINNLRSRNQEVREAFPDVLRNI